MDIAKRLAPYTDTLDERISVAATTLAETIEACLPDGRAKDQAVAHLEECLRWAGAEPEPGEAGVASASADP